MIYVLILAAAGVAILIGLLASDIIQSQTED